MTRPLAQSRRRLSSAAQLVRGHVVRDDFLGLGSIVFALFAAAPRFLYDRTAANESGPLLQLDRTAEVRITARAFSVSSMIWLAAGAIYLLYQPIKLWLFAGR